MLRIYYLNFADVLSTIDHLFVLELENLPYLNIGKKQNSMKFFEIITGSTHLIESLTIPIPKSTQKDHKKYYKNITLNHSKRKSLRKMCLCLGVATELPIMGRRWFLPKKFSVFIYIKL